MLHEAYRFPMQVVRSLADNSRELQHQRTEPEPAGVERLSHHGPGYGSRGDASVHVKPLGQTRAFVSSGVVVKDLT